MATPKLKIFKIVLQYKTKPNLIIILTRVDAFFLPLY